MTKPELNIKISYANLGVYRDKDGVINPGRPKNDDPLQVVNLKDKWISQSKMDPNNEKGMDGMIFPFSFHTFYRIEYIREEGLCGNGILFVDIDCGADYVEKIYNIIPKCNEILGYPIVAAATTKKGIHALFLSNELTEGEYRMMTFIALTSLAWAIKKVSGIDLRDIPGALDACTFSMKQRLFLRYCKEPYWEDMAQVVKYKPEDLDRLKKEYPELYNKACPTIHRSLNSSLKRECSGEVEEIFEVPIHPYLPHAGNPSRWMLFDSLCCCYANDEEELMKQWDRCAELIYPENHGVAHFKEEPRRNNWLKMWNESNSHWCNRELLLEFGYKVKDEGVWYKTISGMPTNIDDLMGLDLSKPIDFRR